MRDEGSSRMPLVTGGKGWDTGRKAALQGRFGLQLWGSVRHPPAQPLPGERTMEPGAGKGDELLQDSQPCSPTCMRILPRDTKGVLSSAVKMQPTKKSPSSPLKCYKKNQH